MVGGAGDLTEVEQQLLMAAAVLGLGPATDLGRATTIRVVNQVLMWRGLTAEQITAGWRDDDCDPEDDAVYAALVYMTRRAFPDGTFWPCERPGPALFEGGGNWRIPGDSDRPASWPNFNSCRLTAEGRAIGPMVVGATSRSLHKRRISHGSRLREHVDFRGLQMSKLHYPIASWKRSALH